MIVKRMRITVIRCSTENFGQNEKTGLSSQEVLGSLSEMFSIDESNSL
jgi:hypothetical protein